MRETPLRIAVLVSGGGTNLQAIIDGIETGSITNTELVLVISNNPGVKALDRAANANVNGVVISPQDYASREEFHQAMQTQLDAAKIDLIVLAGYLVKIPENIIRAYAGRIINIHPALLPAFGGKGFYGLRVHEAALARGVKISGATVHFVTEDLDAGPIILQKAVDVREDDTAESLQRRIMEEAEWKILPAAIDLIANDCVRIEDGKVRIER